jgi:hypothetical protein
MKARVILAMTLIFILMSGTANFILFVAVAECVDVDGSLNCVDAGEADASLFIRRDRAL